MEMFVTALLRQGSTVYISLALAPGNRYVRSGKKKLRAQCAGKDYDHS